MTGGSRLGVAAVSVAAMLCGTASAAAQTSGARSGRTRALDVNVDAFGGWDKDLTEVPADLPIPEQGLLLPGGVLGGVNAGLAASVETRQVLLGASADVSSRWYSKYSVGAVPGYAGTVTLASPVGQKITWSGSERVSYAPVSALPFFSPGAILVQTPVVDYQLGESKQFVSESLGTLGFQVTRRSQIGFSAGYGVLDDPQGLGTAKIRRWSLGSTYSNQMSRYGTLFVGYAYSKGGAPQNAGAEPGFIAETQASALHNINSGFAYRRPLSFSRRTTVSTRIGGTAVDMGPTGIEYRIVGDAGLTHEIGRTWSLEGTYNRDVKFVDTFVQPFFFDGVTVEAAGRVAPRASLAFVSNATRGSVGMTVPEGADGNDVKTYSFSGQLRVGLLAGMALMTEYFWFRSELGALLNLPVAFGNDIERQGIRVGLSFGTRVLGARR